MSSYNTIFTVTDLCVWYGVVETALDLYFDITGVVFYFVYLCFLCPLIFVFVYCAVLLAICVLTQHVNKQELNLI